MEFLFVLLLPPHNGNVHLKYIFTLHTLWIQIHTLSIQSLTLLDPESHSVPRLKPSWATLEPEGEILDESVILSPEKWVSGYETECVYGCGNGATAYKHGRHNISLNSDNCCRLPFTSHHSRSYGRPRAATSRARMVNGRQLIIWIPEMKDESPYVNTRV